MKLSVFHHHALAAAAEAGKEAEEGYAYLLSCGIEAVTLDLAECMKDPTLTARLRRAGLRISAINGYYRFPGEEERIRTHLQIAADAGAAGIMMSPGFFEKGEVPEEVFADETACHAFFDRSEKTAAMCEGMAYAIRQANGRLFVSVEDYDSETSPARNMAGLSWFMQRLPGLGFSLDTGNFAFSGEDAEAALRKFGSRIVDVHVKDRGAEPGHRVGYNRGLRPVAVGDGYLPVAAIVGRLLRQGYDGYFTIEHFGVADYRQAIAASADFLRAAAR